MLALPAGYLLKLRANFRGRIFYGARAIPTFPFPGKRMVVHLDAKFFEKRSWRGIHGSLEKLAAKCRGHSLASTGLEPATPSLFPVPGQRRVDQLTANIFEQMCVGTPGSLDNISAQFRGHSFNGL